MKTLLFIGIGGFIGSVSRYLLARAVQVFMISSFPFGTITVNILGSLLIGLIYGLSERGVLIDPQLRLFLTVGICGGFTTFSTFSAESFYLLRDGQYLWFMAYAFLSISLCLLAVFLGFIISKNI
jgi:fluoride exporter